MASTQWPHASVDLPISLTPLIGRERETATLVSMLGQHDARLLTVTGPGGVGKTRLALHVAADVGAAFPDGVVFVDLATVTDPALVAPVVAAVLGVREASGQLLVDQVRAFLRDKRLLLVLDNFEQVVEAAPLVVTLLAGCAGLAVLATSRVRLRVSGEREYPLSPLGLPDDGGHRSVDALRPSEAVRLFVARAQAVQPDFALSPDNVVVVADICRRLDGLPLAIELAAARIKSLSVSALLSRMESRLPLLTGGGRDLPLRQQTMRDTIAWSYDLLSPEEQTQFQRLAVFVGGFSLGAAEAVAAPSGSGTAFDIISSLLDSSLLLKQEAGDGEPRFRMLETIREFGLERLTASGAEAPARQSHAAWYLALAEAAESSMRGGAAQARWLDRLEADHPNLRAALTWFEQTGDAEGGARLAGTLQGYWLQRSHRSEGRAWLERALAHGVVTNEARAKALLALAVLSQLTGSSEATDLLAQSLALSRSAADSRRAAVALLMLGIDALNRGELDRATSFLVEASELAEQVEDLQTLALARMSLGEVVLHQSGGRNAEPLYQEALTLFRQRDDTYGVASTMLALGRTAADRRDISLAAARYADSLAGWQELGTKEGLVDVLAGVAALAGAVGQPERATRLLAATEALGESVGYTLPPHERGRYDRTRGELRALLGVAAFTAEWTTGLAIPTEHAVAEAKAVLAELLEGQDVVERTASPMAGGLTSREREVLRLVVAGRSNPEIAAALFLSRRTVTTHLTRIFAKLGVHGRAEAAVHAVRHGLV